MATKLLVVGHDAAPSRALRKLVNHAFDNGYSTDFVLLEAGTISAPSEHSLEVKVKNADVVVIGMSTPEENAAIEIAAAHLCMRHGKPFGFYADTHGAYTRKHFKQFAQYAHLVFVVSDDDVGWAEKHFPNANIVITGNPLWADYFKPASREEARALMQALPNEYVVLAPGTKNATHNKTVWSATIKAAGMLKNRFVVCARHPGDKTSNDEYDYLVQLGNEHGVRVSFFSGSTDRCVPGADLVINGTSVRIHALARLIPVIDYFERSSQDWLEKDTGSRTGYFYGSRAVIDVYDETWEDLAGAMNILQDNPTMLRSFQSTTVPHISERDSLDAMLRGIGSTVNVAA
jgi:hypothetical protein